MNNKLEPIEIRDDVTILVGPPQNLIQTAVQYTVRVWAQREGIPRKMPTNKNYNNAIRNLNGALNNTERTVETNPNGNGSSGSSW